MATASNITVPVEGSILVPTMPLATQVYKEKLRELKRSCRSLKKRVEEAEKRPKLIDHLRESINISLGFSLYMKNLTGDLQIFTEVEMTTLEKLVNESMVRSPLWFCLCTEFSVGLTCYIA